MDELIFLVEDAPEGDTPRVLSALQSSLRLMILKAYANSFVTLCSATSTKVKRRASSVFTSSVKK